MHLLFTEIHNRYDTTDMIIWNLYTIYIRLPQKWHHCQKMYVLKP